VPAHPSMRKGADPIDRHRWTIGRAAAGKAAGGRRRRRRLQAMKQALAELGPVAAFEEAGSPRRRRARASHATAVAPAPVQGGRRIVEAWRKRKEIGPGVVPQNFEIRDKSKIIG
jgi:hypothetical protein